MFPNGWFKKEKPLPSIAAFGGGATGLSQSAVVGATGGKIIKDPASGNTFHVFLEPGTIDPAGISGPTMGYLIAAGGGSGGRLGGGGGAGELVCRGSQPFSPGSTYAVVVHRQSKAKHLEVRPEVCGVRNNRSLKNVVFF